MNTKQKYDEKREGSYKPRIEAKHLRKLWLLKQQTGKPITKLVSEALDFYLSRKLERG
jgi:hypothetical protein